MMGHLLVEEILSLGVTFEPAPISSRTCSEFLMEEILSVIREYKEIEDYLNHHPPDNYYSLELKSAQLPRLEKLLGCFRGELYYLVSVTFEGLDKFAITILV
jgi:hypothetical protein